MLNKHILFVGLQNDYGIVGRGPSLEAHYFLPAIREVLLDVTVLWLENIGYPQDSENVQQEIVQHAERIKPDYAIFFPFKDELKYETLEQLKKMTHTICWFSDDQWRFELHSKMYAPYFTTIITTDKFSLKKYRALNCKSVIKSQWASPVTGSENKVSSFVNQVCFVGAKNLTRDWFVDRLERAGISVVCYGQGWKNGKISFSEMTEVFATSTIVLNLSNSLTRSADVLVFILQRFIEVLAGRNPFSLPIAGSIKKIVGYLKFYYLGKKSSEQLKARTFEIPAARGFQLCQFALEIDDYLIPGKEIVLYSTLEECIKLVRYYLENQEEREQIRENGYRAAQNNTYVSRVENIFAELERK